ncbi:MAG: ABC transporter permease [Bacteroidota bacterium]
MKTILQLIRKDYKLFWSDRRAVTMTFIIPIALIIIWGAIFGNIDSGGNAAKLHIAFLNSSTSLIGKKIERVLDSSKTFVVIKSYKDENSKRVPFDTASIQNYVRRGSVSAALVIPRDAYTDTSFGLNLKFYYDPKNDLEMQMIEGMLQKTIMTEIPEIFTEGMKSQAVKFLGFDSGKAFNNEIASVVGRYFKIDPKWITNPPVDSNVSTVGDSNRNKFFQNILHLDKIQLVGQDIANPWATRSVGGWAMMFLLFTLTATSSSLFEEKKSGVVLRLLASPISRVQILWSKYLYNMSLGFIQLVILFTAGCLIYQIDIFSNFFNLLLMIIASSTACTAFGMLLSSISKTAAQANGYGMFLILAMSSIGGAWFPTSFMPDFIQTISKFTIVYWSMDGILQVLWRGVGVVDILPHIGILIGMAVLITSISIWQFKKGHVF